MASSEVEVRGLLRELVQRRNVRALCRVLFGVMLTRGQERIVRAIAFREHQRLAISAYTQYGKTWAVAVGLCLLLVLHRDPIEVQVISATKSQAERLRQYLAGVITACPLLAEDLQLDARGVDRIRKEVSKDRLTFRTGHAIGIQTAHGNADRLMGIGGDVIVKDEAGLFSPEADAKINRMIGGRSKTGTIIEIGNPWSQLTAFYKSWVDPAYHKIKVDWQQGVQEGRITREFVEEQRRRLPPVVFTVLYDSDFPEDTPDALLKWAWIQAAITRHQDAPLTEGTTEWGQDVAEGGTDMNVHIQVLKQPGRCTVTHIEDWHQADTTKTASRVASLVRPEWPGRVDSIGVGKGVCDRLRELGIAATAYKSSHAPRQDRFKNRKAEDYWALRDLLEKGADPDSDEWVSFPDHPGLLADLLRVKYELRNGKIIIYHEGEDAPKTGHGTGSPDYSDALVMAITGAGAPPPRVVREGEKRAPRNYTPGEFYGL